MLKINSFFLGERTIWAWKSASPSNYSQGQIVIFNKVA